VEIHDENGNGKVGSSKLEKNISFIKKTMGAVGRKTAKKGCVWGAGDCQSRTQTGRERQKTRDGGRNKTAQKMPKKRGS